MLRQLDAKEKGFCVKNLDAMREELEYNLYQRDICNLKLKKGLEVEYKKQVRDYKKLRKEFEEEIGILKDKIQLLERQIRTGVEVKEENKESIEVKEKNDVIEKAKLETKLEKEEKDGS